MASELLTDLLLGECLTTPGCEVEFAVGTTYSLDLETLLTIPLTLGMLGEVDDASRIQPQYILEAIRRSTNQFAIFCNAGSIKVPNSQSRVFSMLGDSVNQIELDKVGKGFVNFHPKVWVVRQRNTETHQQSIKIAVMSRNLTFSQDLDIVCALEGNLSTELASEDARKKHKPLADFLLWLSDHADKNAKPKIAELASQISYVEKFTTDERFDDYDFFPIGIGGYNGLETCLNTRDFASHVNQAVIISPFVDKQTLRTLARPGYKGEKLLITRHNNASKEILELFNDGVYAVKQELTEEDEGQKPVDIHMKIYFVNTHGYNFLYLGSANATSNAFDRNIEFLLRLRFATHRTSYQKFKAQFINDAKDCRYAQITAPIETPDEVDDKLEAEQQLRQWIGSITGAKAVKVDDENFNIVISTKKLRATLPIWIQPLQSLSHKCAVGDFGVEINNVPLADLSEFYVVTCGEISRLVKIQTRGIPVDQRDQAIFRSLVNTPRKFMDYLNFMLSDDPISVLNQAAFDESAADNQKGERPIIDDDQPIYENMVRQAYTNPNRIDEIAKVIPKVDPEVLPTGFLDFYNTISKAIKIIRKL